MSKTPRTYIERMPASLKDAEAELVTACGGMEMASALTRVRASQMQRYTAPSEPDCHMPADVIKSLELHCGKPIVSSYLALKTGHVLIDTSARAAADTAVHMALIGQETGELFKHFAESIADGTITKKEAAKLQSAVKRDINALAGLYGDLARAIGGEQ